MDMLTFHAILLYVQHSISFCGVLVILSGVLVALFRYLRYIFSSFENKPSLGIDAIRLRLGRILVLGLEFIVAADLIGTTTAPDYYSVGIVASIVLIRTVLSYTLNR
jgi:uncharacterized membrane protein